MESGGASSGRSYESRSLGVFSPFWRVYLLLKVPAVVVENCAARVGFSVAFVGVPSVVSRCVVGRENLCRACPAEPVLVSVPVGVCEALFLGFVCRACASSPPCVPCPVVL